MKGRKIIKEFFDNSLHQLIHKRGIIIDEIFIQYLIELLTGFFEKEKFNETYTSNPIFESFKIIFLGKGSFERIKNLADFCLFRVGYFPTSFKRSVIGRNCFIISGSQNYHLLAKSLNGKSFLQLFSGLSNHFIFFANILTELRYSFEPPKNDILELYELWLETGNETAEKQLKKMGINPVKISLREN